MSETRGDTQFCGASPDLSRRVIGVRVFIGSTGGFSCNYNLVIGEDGRVTRWYATATDTEDRKGTEEWMRNENLALREQIDRDSMFEDIVGSSKSLRKVLKQVRKGGAF